jgi:hypothetical protein
LADAVENDAIFGGEFCVCHVVVSVADKHDIACDMSQCKREYAESWNFSATIHMTT